MCPLNLSQAQLPSLQGRGWSRAAILLRVIAVLVFLGLIYLLSRNQPLPGRLGQVSLLDIFWKLIVPLVPAILLLVPVLWRNICPLAQFNIIGHQVRSSLGRSPDRPPTGNKNVRLLHSKHGLYVAMSLLSLLVPARLLLLNADSEALAALLAVLAMASFAAGMFFPFKSGWCSSICPVYPVEKTYGMSPLLLGENTLCRIRISNHDLKCAGCIRECLDLKLTPGPGKSVGRTVKWRPGRGLRLFISAFPGFVAAYLVLSQYIRLEAFMLVPRCLLVYCSFLAMVLVSAGIYRVLERRLSTDVGAKRLDLLFVALAFNLYYWMAVPGVVAIVGSLLSTPDTVGLHSSLANAIGACGIFLLTACWLWRNW